LHACVTVTPVGQYAKINGIEKTLMTSILLQDPTVALALGAADPEERFTITGVDWSQYEHLLVKLGDRVQYRVTYLEGMLEIMSPSREHELQKKNISRLLEAYFEETRTRFWGLGSTTFRRQAQQGGTEPDECYCIGEEKALPDLAIEIVLTSGGIDKLEVYRRLAVREVWFWQNQQFGVYYLHDEQYTRQPNSVLLPNLDLMMLAEYAVKSDPLAALLEYRARLRQHV
jgi:Uma2 family endonuclease